MPHIHTTTHVPPACLVHLLRVSTCLNHFLHTGQDVWMQFHRSSICLHVSVMKLQIRCYNCHLSSRTDRHQPNSGKSACAHLLGLWVACLCLYLEELADGHQQHFPASCLSQSRRPLAQSGRCYLPPASRQDCCQQYLPCPCLFPTTSLAVV